MAIKIKKILRLFTDKGYRVSKLSKLGIYNKMSDEKFLKKIFKLKMGNELNLDEPRTFNEKLQWLKLYDRKPIYTTMVDKYEAKKHVADIIGEEYIIPTLGVWDKFEDIDFDSLPNRFVLKCTHDSGGLVICKDKSQFNIAKARKKINRSLKRNFYYRSREWPYKNVKPRIIAEEYMEDTETAELRDYKFFCFNGIPKMVLVCADRFSNTGLRENFYDTEWSLLAVQRPNHPNTNYEIEKPKSLSQMIEFAKVLSKDTSFSRIDFYNINGKIYFGEITFFPASGLEKFSPEEWDYKLGSWIDLPK